MKRHKVFGIGLNKTGTKTLGACLRLLGYRHVTHRRDLLIDWHNGRLDRIFDVCDANDSFEDWPFPLIFEEAFARYGESARYILTVRRSAEVWIRSLKNHALITRPNTHSRVLAYGMAYPHGLEARHIAAYEAHNRRVTDFFAARGVSHLLKVACWEAGDGWESLCAFLGEPVPAVAMPHENRRERVEIESSPYLKDNEERIREQLGLLGMAAPPSLIE